METKKNYCRATGEASNPGDKIISPHGLNSIAKRQYPPLEVSKVDTQILLVSCPEKSILFLWLCSSSELLHFEPFLDALSLRSDVISSMKILPPGNAGGGENLFLDGPASE